MIISIIEGLFEGNWSFFIFACGFINLILNIKRRGGEDADKSRKERKT